MTAKANFQKKYANNHNKHIGAVAGFHDLAGEVWEAKSAAVETLAANATLTALDSGKTFLCNLNNLVVSLPATAAGLRYKFINIPARTTAKLSISPVAADGISGTTGASTNVVIAGVVNKDIINTAGTQEVGDSVEIVGTGITGTKAWIITSCSGIWAAE